MAEDKLDSALINAMTSGLRYLTLNPEVVSVTYRKFGKSKQNQCYSNAFHYLSDHPSAKFVLGYIFLHGSIPIEHAWVYDGAYFDITIDPNPDDVFLKLLELDMRDVVEFASDTSHAPDLYNLNRWSAEKSHR